MLVISKAGNFKPPKIGHKHGARVLAVFTKKALQINWAMIGVTVLQEPRLLRISACSTTDRHAGVSVARRPSRHEE